MLADMSVKATFTVARLSAALAGTVVATASIAKTAMKAVCALFTWFPFALFEPQISRSRHCTMPNVRELTRVKQAGEDNTARGSTLSVTGHSLSVVRTSPIS